MIPSKGVLSYRGLVATDRDRQMGFDPLSLLSDIPTHDSILLPLNLQPSALLPEPAAVTCLAQVLSCSIFMHAGDFSERTRQHITLGGWVREKLGWGVGRREYIIPVLLINIEDTSAHYTRQDTEQTSHAEGAVCSPRSCPVIHG
ncbi:hypothetical protein RRG08_001818 [Elysia crispata]|uniref:Uncharacterized protein n=1 Tax=Elysia crispata TaxID=231223 RepID=A0AAE1CTQ6_9GAST|nr:hypothetical protein RRG08_001818 [Elysia crispata]